MRRIYYAFMDWLFTTRRRRKTRLIKNRFAECGSGLAVYGDPRIIAPERISLGNNISLNDGCVLNASYSSIKIGNNCTVSSGSQILAATYDTKKFLFNNSKEHVTTSVIIGDNVWVCAGAIICPGVHICSGVIVGAGAVVTKSIQEKNVIIAGNPAKIVKRLVNDIV